MADSFKHKTQLHHWLVMHFRLPRPLPFMRHFPLPAPQGDWQHRLRTPHSSRTRENPGPRQTLARMQANMIGVCRIGRGLPNRLPSGTISFHLLFGMARNIPLQLDRTKIPRPKGIKDHALLLRRRQRVLQEERAPPIHAV